MPWNRTTREEYKREAVRYESDIADVEWALVETPIPRPGQMDRP